MATPANIPAISQAWRPLQAEFSGLPADRLIALRFTAVESLSALFHFRVDIAVLHQDPILFETVLGKGVLVRLESLKDSPRLFNGLCIRFAETGRDDEFTYYTADLVPNFWRLTKRVRTRVFQHQSTPTILKEVLKDVPFSFQLKGNYEPRNYCVQYRESDFDFCSRLMEEEGIFYFHRHEDRSHILVAADGPTAHAPLNPAKPLVFDPLEGGWRPDEERVTAWRRTQEVRSGMFHLCDHKFELPHKQLDARKSPPAVVYAGTLSHDLKAGDAKTLEMYDYPGDYAVRYDGVDKSGGDRPDDLQNIFTDNERAAEARQQAETAGAVVIEGAGNVARFIPGSRFKLCSHPNADGDYVLTEVRHQAEQLDPRSGGGGFSYDNSFRCIPDTVPYRPARVTPKPFVQGSQTAVVVGPKGEEVFTDKYGRIKVQFHWDLEGAKNADSSCWVRVAQLSAGKRWGTSFWPRVGQEVIVSFLEGNPDAPIVVGSVYNSEQMPPYLGNGLDSKHPKNNRITGFKSNSSMGGKGFNEWRFDDTAGKEQIFQHAQRDFDLRVKRDMKTFVGGNVHIINGKAGPDGDAGDHIQLVRQDKHLHVEGKEVRVTLDGKEAKIVGGDAAHWFKKNRRTKVATTDLLEAPTIVVKAGTMLSLEGPGGFITIDSTGVTIVGTMVKINSGGVKGSMSVQGPLFSPGMEAVTPEAKKPDEAEDSKTGYASRG
ncbi:MAG: type VI secretion system Vgr family protein [Planctomycetia bacterium]